MKTEKKGIKEIASMLVLNRKVEYSILVECLLKNWIGKSFTINEVKKRYAHSYHTIEKKIRELTNAGVLKVSSTARGYEFEFVFQKDEIENLIAELREIEFKMAVNESELNRANTKAAQAALEQRISEIEERLDSYYKENKEELEDLRKKYFMLNDAVKGIQTKLQNAGLWQ
jgi:DNA repair exonuclease SbcCD ATPase subunit